MIGFAHQALGITSIVVFVLCCGLAGSCLRALVTYGARGFLQRQTIVDAVVGGAGGVIIPKLFHIDDWPGFYQGLVVMALCYVLADLAVNILRKTAPGLLDTLLRRIVAAFGSAPATGPSFSSTSGEVKPPPPPVTP